MPNQENTVKLTAEISASSNGLISALKQASSAINDTTGNWHDKFSQLKDSTSLISQSVKNLGELVAQAGDADMSHLSASLGEVQSSFSKVQAEVGAFSQQLSELKNRASELGMPVDDFQRFAQAVENANVGMEQGSTAIRNMQKNITAMMNGMPEAKALFDQLGISLETLGSNSVMGNLTAIASAMQSVVPSTEQAKASMDMFGTSMQDMLHLSQEYGKVLANQNEGMFASDKDVQNAISLTAAIGKLGDQITKITGVEGQATAANGDLGDSYKDLFNYINTQKKELADLLVTYQKYVEGLKRVVTSTSDSDGAVRLFSEHIGTIANEVEFDLDRLRKTTGKDILDVREIDSLPSVKKLKYMGTFIKDFRKALQEEITAVHGIANQRLDLGAPIDTKELDMALDHIEKLRPAVETYIEGLSKLGEMKGVGVPKSLVKDAQQLLQFINDSNEALSSLQTSSFHENFTLKLESAKKEYAELEKTIESMVERANQSGKIEIIDPAHAEELLNKFCALREELDKLKEMEGDVGAMLLEKGAGEEIDGIADKLITIEDEIEKLNYEASKNPFEKLWDGAKKFGNALRHPIDGTKTLRDRVSDLGGKGFRTAVTGVVEIGKAFVHPIDQCRKLKDQMDKFVASTHRAKSVVKQIGDGSGGLAKNMNLTAADAKQALGQMAGMGGKLGFIVWAGRTFLNSLNMWIKGFTEAAKQAREIQEILSEQQTGVAQRNEQRAEGLVGALRKYAELRDKIAKEGNATDMDELAKLQREISVKYGVELKEGAEEFREAFQWADNMKKDAIESQIASLEKLNKALANEEKELKSVWRNVLKYRLDAGGWLQSYDRANAIQRERGRNDDQIAELREKLRVAQAGNELGDWESEQSAKTKDETRKKQEEATKTLEDAIKKLVEWENSITDTEQQKQLREIWKKYADAVNAGVSPLNARAVALKAIAEMLKEEKETEQKKHEELVKAMEERVKAYRSAYEAYVQADKAVVDAKREYAKTQAELNREAKSERISRRRERLQKAMGRFGFTPFEGFKLDESSSERRERRRNAQIDASISEKMGRAQAGDRVHWTRAEKERLGEFQKLQRKDKQLEAAQKQMEAAEKQRKSAEQLHEAAKAIQTASKGMGEASRNLGTAIGDIIGNALPKRGRKAKTDEEAREVFDNMGLTLNAKGVPEIIGEKQSQATYNGQLDLLHKDLQNIMRNTYLVK